MSISDLDLILKKDPIITTFPVSQLQAQPGAVEQVYLTHAKTHLSLGDTEKHVDTIFRWVSGQNKGAFIGAVEGNYGEGKTSFLVHVWATSVERKVFTVPPFEWISLADAVTAVGAWMGYILGRTHPMHAKKAERLYQEFRQKSLEEAAHDVAKRTEGDYETILATLKDMDQRGVRGLTEVTPERFLDFLAHGSEIVREVGYQGLLVMLDEPEVAAKQVGREQIAHLLFDLSNLLHEQQGEYGVLVSMPSNFLADVSRRFPALTARLQARNCFPRLRDVYGPGLAEQLWSRYVTEFDLGEEGSSIVSPLALQAIGQVGSSERADLSYGPRTVVSAFSRMVYHYRETGRTYEPEDFVQDCLDQEIMARPEYATKVREILASPEITASSRAAVTLLAAFPNGLPLEIAQSRGLEPALRDLARRGTLVYKTAATFGLNVLRTEGPLQSDPLRDAILDVDSEFAPNRKTFASAIAAFREHILALVFEPRVGQQLVGWEQVCSWSPSPSGVWVGGFVGAFLQTQKQYPKRAILAIVSSADSSLDDVGIPDLPSGSGPQDYDAVFHFRLRWHAEQELPRVRLKVDTGDPAQRKFACVTVTLDLLGQADVPPRLSDVVETENVTLLWLLNLIHEVDKESLPREFEAQWKAMRTTMLRDMIPLLFGEDLGALAGEQLGQTVTGSGLGLLGSLLQRILAARYPDYSTLICTPHWQSLVDDYIRALKSSAAPLACKRGRERWLAEGDLAPKVLGTSRMNLTGGTFAGLENLLLVSSRGRSAPIEVEFRIHPLEQTIADLICADRPGAERKLKIGGKECWWMPVDGLLPTIQTSGYTVDELAKIVAIGSSRGTFEEMQHRGKRIVYCKPIDPDQMRRQLEDKLSALNEELAEFRRLPEFVSSVDAKKMAEQIARVQDEAEYDQLLTRLNKEFEQLHQRLPGYSDRLAERLQTARNDAQQSTTQLASSREATLLKSRPASKSAWGDKLNRYIVGNLGKMVEELKSDSAALVKDANGYLSQYKHQTTRPARDNLALLIEGQSQAIDAQTRAKSLKGRAQNLMGNLRDYEQWLKLLRRSDEVYEPLLELKDRGLDTATVEGLLAEFDGLCQQISDHLETRNVPGLSTHKHFATALDEIDKKRLACLVRVKGEFDRCKQAVNALLEALKLDRRVTTTFDHTNSGASYKELYETGATYIREAGVSQILAEIEAQERELRYARDILASLEVAEAALLLARLSAARSDLAALAARATKEWVRQATDQDTTDERAAAAQTIAGALDAVRAARNLVKSATKAVPPTEGRASAMYARIPLTGSLDLKDIILKMMPGTENAEHVLDESLASLVELFRANCVQIRVERR